MLTFLWNYLPTALPTLSIFLSLWNFIQHDLRFLPNGKRHKGTVHVLHLHVVFARQIKQRCTSALCTKKWFPSLNLILLPFSLLLNQSILFLFGTGVTWWSSGFSNTCWFVSIWFQFSANSYRKLLKVDMSFNLFFKLEYDWKCPILPFNLSITKRYTICALSNCVFICRSVYFAKNSTSNDVNFFFEVVE